MQLVDQPNGTFTTSELARLAAYRAAVQAGFFTDWDGSASCTDTALLAWLPRASAASAGAGEGDPAAYPFTAEERQKLDRLRAALEEGGDADDRPCTDNSAGQ